MKCDTVKDCLDRLRDGSLSQHETGSVREHLTGCSPCGTEWEVTEKLRAAIRDRVSTLSAPAAFRELMAQLLGIDRLGLAG